MISSEKSCTAAYLLFSASWEQHVIWDSCWAVLLFQNSNVIYLMFCLLLSQNNSAGMCHVLCLLFQNNSTAQCCSPACTEMRWWVILMIDDFSLLLSVQAFKCSAFLLWSHACSCETELFWLCEWFFFWLDLEHEFSQQKLVNNRWFKSDALYSKLWEFIICNYILKLIWITTLYSQSTDWWILINNLCNSQCLLSNASFWAAASAELLLQCLQHSFSFSCDSISLFVIVCQN